QRQEQQAKKNAPQHAAMLRRAYASRECPYGSGTFARMRILIVLLLALLTGNMNAQKKGERHLVQFSGVVVAGDSLEPVPFASVVPKGSFRGTMSDVYGYFS